MLACANTLKIIDGCGESKGQATKVESHSRGRLCHNSSKWDSTQGLRQWVLLFRPLRAWPFFRQPSDHGQKCAIAGCLATNTRHLRALSIRLRPKHSFDPL